jgi:hypothetical protein
MLLARTKADKMEALMKRSQTHWIHSRRTRKTSIKAYNLGVHAFKKSQRKWAATVSGTKKTLLHKQMVLKKAWMRKVHIAMVNAKKTVKGFKANMAKWRVRWLAARGRMNLMKRRAASAKVYFGKVTIVMRTAHRKLITMRKVLKTKLHLKMKFMRMMHKAKRHCSIQLKATAIKKKFALKMFASMKHAIKVFVGHRGRMVKAVAAAKAQKIRTLRAIRRMRAEYATMMAWKKAQLRAKAREQSAFRVRAKAIKANRLAYLRYLAAVKARRHAHGRKQAAIRSRRHAQLRAHGQLKA